MYLKSDLSCPLVMELLELIIKMRERQQSFA